MKKFLIGIGVFVGIFVTLGIIGNKYAGNTTTNSPTPTAPLSTAKASPKTTAPFATQVPTQKPTQPPTSLSTAQKVQVTAIITANTNHFKKLWSDGKLALGTTQYANSYEGLAAIDDPSSSASKFSQYKQTENPANDNTMNDAFTQADKYYPDSVSDDNLNTWRIDMIQLSSDMGVWVDKATSWQISEISSNELASAESAVNSDFSKIEKDIQVISQ